MVNDHTNVPDRCELFLTADEAANLLRVSKRLIYDMIRAGELECVRCGRLVRIPRAAIERLAQAAAA